MAWKDGDPVEYDAHGEYLKIMRDQNMPGNLPMSSMRRMMAKMADPHIKEEMAKEAAGRSKIALQWARMAKTAKIEHIVDMVSQDDIVELLGLEPDDDVCECLINRRRELRAG